MSTQMYNVASVSMTRVINQGRALLWTTVALLLEFGLNYLRATGDEASRPLECYQCGSEVVGDEFCGQTFQEDKIPEVLEKLGNSAVKVCNSSSEFLVPACRKTVEEVNGVVVTKRFCFYINKSDSVNCLKPHDNSQIFCQDCFTDKCNSAPQVIAQKLAFLVIPLILAKLSVL